MPAPVTETENAPLATYNRGIVDDRAIGRVDIKRIALAASTQTNWMPRALGAMSLRPGMEKVAESYNSKQAKHIPFVFSFDDQAMIEITAGIARILIDDRPVKRPLNNTSIANGTFDTNLDNWTDSDESGATSAQKTVDGKGVLSLIGTRFNAAIRDQEVFVTDGQSSPGKVISGEPMVYGRESRVTGDPGVRMMTHGPHAGIHQHAIRVVVHRGPVVLTIGAAKGEQDYIAESFLNEGVHSIAFTPRGNFWVRLSNREEFDVLVDSITIEGPGPLTIPVPYNQDDLKNLRWDQSGDIVFLACNGHQQYRIERRGSVSWSIIKYLTADGPFRVINTSSTTITSNALSGECTLTASTKIFSSAHLGALYRLRSVGQTVTAAVTGDGQWSDGIRVVGVDNSRIFQITITGTWTATVTLQRSIDDESSWTDVTTYASNQASVDYDDSLDNTIAFYRIGVDTGDFTSGTANVKLVYSGGGITGVVRVHTFTSDTSVGGSVVVRLGSTAATNEWYEGVWSDKRGWPTSTVIYEGRLWWFGRDWILGSVTDSFHSFDDEIFGDSSPLVRTIGQGPVDVINWGLGLQRLVIGIASGEVSIRASAFDEPLSTGEFNLKFASTKGSAPIRAVTVDSRGVFIDRSTFKVWEMEYSFDSNDYGATDLSLLVPDIGRPGFVHMDKQTHPDVRLHCLRSDGTVACLVYDPGEEVRAWIPIETGDADGVNGVVTDVVILPGKEEDKVYYQVRRIIDGKPRHYLEKWALESECIGETISKQADSFVQFLHPTPKSTIDELEHLEGQTVVVWADGKCLDDANGDIATFTVSSGSITVTDGGSATTVTQGVVGIQYVADFKSAELPYGASQGTTLTRRQQINQIGFLLANTHHKGIEFGRDADNLDTLPQVIQGATVADDTIHSFLSEEGVTFPGSNDPNTRLYLRATAPRPATVMASVLELDTTET